ncbi:hypothetical protein [uncultured Phocaeicola sp.]|uniref:leucine-rich repeat domain-containing protein n=1 Tax=uncultured Phocaeicola sp. TaxID=990718 RepID=UPI0025D8FCAB|nr:hypothetical protein [uncultured Phocaeicola sp.]
MKHIWIISLSAIAFSLASCNQSDELDSLQHIQDETESQTDKDRISVSFTALSPTWTDDSRTSLEENNEVYWNNGDEIVVCYGNGNGINGNSWFWTEMEEEKAATAVFNGYTPIDGTEFWAFYPSYNFLHTAEYQLYFRIPVRQEAVAGTFANNLNPAWAYTDQLGGNLQFHNIASLVKFTLADGVEDIKSVTFTARKSSAVLTGDYMLDVQDVNNPVVMKSTNYDAEASRSVILSGTFEAGKPYYFVVATVDNDLEEGFTFVFEKTDGTKYVKEAKAGVISQLESGRIANVGTISLSGATFTNDILDLNFIAAVEKRCGDPGWSKNADGTVSLTEENLAAMQQITHMDLSNAGLTSLDGINNFTGLTYLDCSENSLSDVDLSQLTNLQTLIAENSEIESLNVDNLSELKVLRCRYNKLKELNVGQFSQLEELDCSGNSLTRLDAENLISLTSLKYSYNQGINTLDVGKLINLKTLECDGNGITDLDVTALTGLETLRCSYNDLSELNVGTLSSLKVLAFSGNHRISTVDLSNLTYLEELDLSDTGLETIDVSCFPNLRYLYCDDMQSFNGLNVSKNTELRGLSCANSGITSLDLSQNEKLEYLYCQSNKLQVLDLRNNLRLYNFNCSKQHLEGGAKMKLYIKASQELIWNNVAYYHSATVDVEIDHSLYNGSGHDSFDETDHSGVLVQ